MWLDVETIPKGAACGTGHCAYTADRWLKFQAEGDISFTSRVTTAGPRLGLTSAELRIWGRIAWYPPAKITCTTSRNFHAGWLRENERTHDVENVRHQEVSGDWMEREE